jgi:uncharacterized protein YfdQ (DUF2303 family)
MSEAEKVAELAVLAEQPTVIKNAAGREFIAWGAGQFAPISEPNLIPEFAPQHIKQAVQLQTADSLVDYAKRFACADSLILADISRNRIRLAVDYHAKDKAGFIDHNAELALPFSQEWTTWVLQNGRLLGQLEFARFIEENAADIAAPSGADLLEISRDLQLARKADFRKVVRTASGDERFEYSESETASCNGLEIPSKFLLKLPVYFGEAPVSLAAFLRYQLNDGKVVLGFSLNRHENVRQAEFQRIVTNVAKATGLLAVYGTPD